MTVVPIPIEQAARQQEAAPIEPPAAQGAISGVPNIPTANKDNIYLLGAYSNFNVVPSQCQHNNHYSKAEIVLPTFRSL